MKFYIVRHAKAEKRRHFDAPDPLRPLAPQGLRQSKELASVLAAEGPTRIVSSPHLRCAQTVEPLAVATSLPLELDERLAEGGNPKKALDLLSEAGDGRVVLCSHGDLIAGLLYELENRGVHLETPGRLRCQKASIWVAEAQQGEGLRATYRPAPKSLRKEDGDREHLAVLDLGSTSFRLVLFQATRAGRLKPRLNERIMLRLGAAIGPNGNIPETTCKNAVETARRLAELAWEAGADVLLPVATAALRDAANGAELAARIGEALGTPVRIASGEEEARLLFLAFQRRVLLPQRPTLGIDLGGGSLELAIGNTREIQWEATLPIGVARLHREFVRTDPISERAMRRLRKRLLEALEEHRSAIDQLAPTTCVAAGGSARAFARLARARRGPGRSTGRPVEIPLDELEELTRLLVRADHDERLSMRGIRKDRADLLPTAGILLTALAKTLGIASYTVCDWGIREGVVLEAIASN